MRRNGKSSNKSIDHEHEPIFFGVPVKNVRLCGYKNGEIGRNHSQQCQNGTPEKLTLDEIASQLGTSKRDLQRALSIERNLTDSMKCLYSNNKK